MTETTTTAPLTSAFADFALGLQYEDLSNDVIGAAKHSFLDTLGVALVGAAEEASHIVLDVCGGAARAGTATVLGTNLLVVPSVAALVNGYAAHVLDYDDTQHRVGLHISAPVVASALAVAEMQHASGKDLLAAYIVGFEVGCRLGRAARFARRLSELGVHATGYLGHFAAAAAAGRLLSLSNLQMRHAYGIAAGHASGLMVSFGTMAKAQNAANAAQNGMLAALLAKRGFTGPERIFDGDRNIFSIFGEKTNPEEIMAGLGREFEVTHNTLKLFACAGWRNPIIEASIALANKHRLKPSDIAKVNIWAHKNQLHLPNYKEPRTGLESKFSAEHASAVAFVDGAGTVGQFTDERVNDSQVSELRRKVTLALDDKLEPYQIRLAVHTTDGRDLTHFIPVQKGDPRNPASWDEVVMKFQANAGAVLPRKNVEKLAAQVRDLEKVDDIAEVLNLCHK